MVTQTSAPNTSWLHRFLHPGAERGPWAQALTTVAAILLLVVAISWWPAWQWLCRMVVVGVAAFLVALGWRMRGQTLAWRSKALLFQELRRHWPQLRDRIAAFEAAMLAVSQEQAQCSRHLKDLVVTNSDGADTSTAITTAHDVLQNHLTQLHQRVAETLAAMESLVHLAKEVAQKTAALKGATTDTAGSMNKMDISISHVEANANETSQLSQTVSGDAEIGAAAIQQTILGIDKIKESSRIGAEVIGHLVQRITQIIDILNVIDDVAEQTNLLALNAAIIAAQAGEHGRGFAVVADEIKALAERTGASTKEIAQLVKTIEDQSRSAIAAMSQGVRDVEEGVRLGGNAAAALHKIVASAKRATLMVQSIAQTTVEQARGSKQVTNAISVIDATVQEINVAMGQQAKGAEKVQQSVEQMRAIAQLVSGHAGERHMDEQKLVKQLTQLRVGLAEIGESQQKRSATHPPAEQLLAELHEALGQAHEIVVSLGDVPQP